MGAGRQAYAINNLKTIPIQVFAFEAACGGGGVVVVVVVSDRIGDSDSESRKCERFSKASLIPRLKFKLEVETECLPEPARRSVCSSVRAIGD